ncbi:hypothetical protein PsAD13_03835 [Pseudovibrio sp. Ad13]|uniref:DUF6898 family protein n=1 Tax=unclassified Pseudovibrio TaxID=2627060 RepID=UPI00070CDB41|nr:MULTISPECIES: hypothetical protein [unclassified Pseudovibrio]KZK82276.1 hypothetical protein PsAD13_03835 [Pseudovibrio sp. Ad13]KZK99479.1 hypothetical protein PsAD5_01501 [Pseudovibrio sp. Ad5]KZL02913.1 hypothetical protein PsW74_01112 [Pseudovibrio sp. W74]KZL07616.1 hypothetical protein PsAD14_04006 [Pseudovibrio sp. Ad14]KZL18195.1 hypothetical protein PsAD37_03950 [Pseudovibrio sp. Ad37]
MSKLGQVYFETRVVGNAVRMTAICAQSGVEVFVVGPRNASESHLKQLALRKLERKLQPQDA